LLTDTISELHLRSRGTYGKRRIRAALAIERGLIVNPKLITKITHDLSITGLPARKKGRRNLVNVATYEEREQREFQAPTANAIWLTDNTEHPTRDGTVYCCCMLDLYSRKVVGWAIDRRCEATFVNDALSVAARSRSTSSSTVIHSDHGS
jgi:transposase InsO family protein